jgi:hypothetical protein
MKDRLRLPFSRPILALSLLLLAPTATSANDITIVDTFTLHGISTSTRFTILGGSTIAIYQSTGPAFTLSETTTITEIGGFLGGCRECPDVSPFVVQIRPAIPIPGVGPIPDPDTVLATFTLTHDDDPLLISYEFAQINLTFGPGTYFAMFAPSDPKDIGALLMSAGVPGFIPSTVQLGFLDLETGRSFGPSWVPAAVRILGHRTLAVTLDVKPGSFPNVINPRSRGVIPVAVVAAAGFDPTRMDLETLAFGPAGAEPAQAIFKDFNSDGLTDLLLHFRTEETGFTCADASATLMGRTTDGQLIEGTDAIRTVGCK